jgi:hypothetical protein
VVPSWLISYSKEELAATSKSREQRGVETIEGCQQEEGNTSKDTPKHKKRMEAQASNSNF